MPIIPIPGGARGYSFLYTRSGGASDDFVIALPKTMPNVNFLATVQSASGPDDFVDGKVVRADNTTTTIHIVTASPIADGTQLIVTVNGVASRVMPVATDGVTIGGTGVTGDELHTLGAVAATACFAWKVGVPWATIYAAMSAVAGPKICLVEFDPTRAPRAMTSNGGVPQNLNNVLFMGIGGSNKGGEGFTKIAVANGFKLTGDSDTFGERVLLTSQNVSWDFSALTSPAYTTPDPTNDRAVLTLSGGHNTGLVAPLAVISGTAYFALDNVISDGAWIESLASGFSSIVLSGGSSIGGAFVIDNGDFISIFADSTCEFSSPALATLPSVSVVNLARGDDHQNYFISVVGGVVTATVA